MSNPELLVLGGLRLRREGTDVELGPPQQRAVLALLALNPDTAVTVGALLEAIWGSRPPGTAANVLHRHVGAIRRLLEPDLPLRTPGSWLARTGEAYRLRLTSETSDLLRFRALLARARTDQDLTAYTRAMDLWRGPAAAGVALGAGAGLAASAVDRERSQAALEACALACLLAAGEPREPDPALVEAVRAAASAAPLDERLHAGLITLLGSTGRRAEALDVVAGLRERLSEDLGVAPGPQVQDAFLTLLRAGPDEAELDLDRERSTPGRRPSMVPPQLPWFSGRGAEELALDEILADHLDHPEGAGVAVLHGMGGVGKTALATHWARRHRDEFPGGHLFVDLHGFHPDRRPIAAFDALRLFLVELGVAPSRVPAGLEDRWQLFRDLVHGRRVLVVLDNVRDPEQVRPLLPPVPGTFTLVTSRSRLTGLVASVGAVPVHVDVQDPERARAALLGRLGRDGTRLSRADEAAVTDIVDLCAGLPLALSVTAARLLTSPGFTLPAVAAQMRSGASRLGAFDVGDSSVGVRATLRWSYEALSPRGRLAFRLASIFRGYEGSVDVMACSCSFTREEAERTVQELLDVRLLEERRPGRFQAHDLICAFSFEICAETDDDEVRRAARDRLVAYYARSLRAALATLQGSPDAGRRAGPVVAHLPDATAVRRWFADERRQVLATLGDLTVESYGASPVSSRGRFDELAALLQTLDAALAD